MKHLIAAALLLFGLAACATPGHVVEVQTGSRVGYGDLAERLRSMDVVFLGELHENDDGHRAHFALVRQLHGLRPDLVISMEMFERDVQALLWQYLVGAVSEEKFLAESRPWKRYQAHYRPFIEFAKSTGIPVLAANTPREMAARVAQEGLESVAGEQYAAREVQAPKDDYWSAFRGAMGDHPGMDEAQMERYYQAQCLKDETMAETIVDYLDDARATGRSPLIVHIVGAFHSDHGRGTVARVARRDPALRLAVLSMTEVDDPSKPPSFDLPGPGDYVVVVREQPRSATPADRPAPAAQTVTEVPATPPMQAGTRPALGFLPDYHYREGDGLRVEEVTPGGPAAEAGIAAGDVILTLGGETVEGLESYVEALDLLEIGAETEVLLRRGSDLHRVKVGVGSR